MSATIELVAGDARSFRAQEPGRHSASTAASTAVTTIKRPRRWHCAPCLLRFAVCAIAFVVTTSSCKAGILVPTVGATAGDTNETATSDRATAFASEDRSTDDSDDELSELVASLPEVGLECYYDAQSNALVVHPSTLALRRRLNEGATLSDRQWRQAIAASSMIRIRPRWPQTSPVAIALAVPLWLQSCRITVRLPAELGGGVLESRSTNQTSIHGHSYLELCSLPLGVYDLMFGLRIERTAAVASRRDGELKLDLGPRVFWDGTVTTRLQIVESLCEAMESVDNGTIRDATAGAVVVGTRPVWADSDWREQAFVAVEPNLGVDPGLTHVGLSLRVELLHDGKPLEVVRFLVLPAGGAKAERVHPVSEFERFSGSSTLTMLPVTALVDLDELSRWSLKITGTADNALRLWCAETTWTGTVEVAASDAYMRWRHRVEGR